MNDTIKTTSVVMAQIQYNAIVLLDMKGYNTGHPKYYEELEMEMNRLKNVAKKTMLTR